jgi:mono/diheme cytochrome c family protein
MPRVVKRRSPRVVIISLGIMIGLLLVAVVMISRSAASGTDPADQALVAQGKAVYSANCASCHGATLAGQPNWKEPLPSGIFPAPPHDASGHTWHHPDAMLFTIVKDGGAGPLRPGEQRGMPAFGTVLSDADIWAVLSYIKSTWPSEIQQRHTAVSAQNP